MKVMETESVKSQTLVFRLFFIKGIVLVLARMELIFFVVASMGLCFGFVLKTVLITQGCFGYC